MVRRVLAVILIGLGVFGLVLAVLFPTVVVPRSKKTPLDLNITVRSTGTAQLLNATTNKADTVDLRATRVVQTDSEHSNSKDTTVKETLCIVVVVGQSPDCLRAENPPPTEGPRLLSYTTDTVTTDRKSGESVDKPEWGGNVNGDYSVKRQGMAYKWPIDAKKKDYLFYSPDLKKAFNATYKSTSKIKGLTVYEYVCETGDQSYTIQGSFPGKYNDTRTVYVEPKTGVIVKGIEHQVQTLDSGEVALDTTFQFDEPSIQYQVDYANKKIDQLKRAQLWAPLGCGVLGLICLAGGLFLLRGGRGGPGTDGAVHAAPVGGLPDDVNDTRPLASR